MEIQNIICFVNKYFCSVIAKENFRSLPKKDLFYGGDIRLETCDIVQ